MIKIATCQLLFEPDVEKRKDKVLDILKKASVEKSDFICLPEGFLTGYCEEKSEAYTNSLQVGKSCFTDWLEVIAEGAPEATVIVGFNERCGDSLFDSAAIISCGKLLGVQRKHYLYHDYFTSGSTFSTWQHNPKNGS